MNRIILIVALVFACLISYGQVTPKRSLAATVTFNNFAASGGGYKGTLAFNDQTNTYTGNDVATGDVVWVSSTGALFSIDTIYTQTLSTDSVFLTEITSVGLTPSGTGQLERRTTNFGLSVFSPDNANGISQQLKSIIESHNPYVIDSILNDLELAHTIKDTFFIGDGSNDVTVAEMEAFFGDYNELIFYVEKNGDASNLYVGLPTAANYRGKRVTVIGFDNNAGTFRLYISGNIVDENYSAVSGDTIPSGEIRVSSFTSVYWNGSYRWIKESWDGLDNSASNELQTLSLLTNTLSLTDGGSVDLSGYLDNTDTQLTEAQVVAIARDTGFLEAESDPIWISDSADYAQKTYFLDVLADTAFDIRSSISETDPIWISDSADYAQKTYFLDVLADTATEIRSAISSGGGGADLSTLSLSDTSTFSVELLQDSTAVKRRIWQYDVQTRADIVGKNYPLGSRIKVADTGAEYLVQTDSISTNLLDVIPLNSKYAVQQLANVKIIDSVEQAINFSFDAGDIVMTKEGEYYKAFLDSEVFVYSGATQLELFVSGDSTRYRYRIDTIGVAPTSDPDVYLCLQPFSNGYKITSFQKRNLTDAEATQRAIDYAFWTMNMFRSPLVDSPLKENKLSQSNVININTDLEWTDTVAVRENIHLIGVNGGRMVRSVGPAIVVNLNDSNKYALTLLPIRDGDYAGGIVLENLRFAASSPAKGAINLLQPYNTQINNVFIEGKDSLRYFKKGIYIDYGIFTHLNFVKIRNIDGPAVEFGPNLTTTTTWRGLSISYCNNGIYAPHKNSISDVTFYNPSIESIDSSLFIIGQSNYVHVDQLYTEQSPLDGPINGGGPIPLFIIGEENSTVDFTEGRFKITNSSIRSTAANMDSLNSVCFDIRDQLVFTAENILLDGFSYAFITNDNTKYVNLLNSYLTTTYKYDDYDDLSYNGFPIIGDNVVLNVDNCFYKTGPETFSNAKTIKEGLNKIELNADKGYIGSENNVTFSNPNAPLWFFNAFDPTDSENNWKEHLANLRFQDFSSSAKDFVALNVKINNMSTANQTSKAAANFIAEHRSSSLLTSLTGINIQTGTGAGGSGNISVQRYIRMLPPLTGGGNTTSERIGLDIDNLGNSEVNSSIALRINAQSGSNSSSKAIVTKGGSSEFADLFYLSDYGDNATYEADTSQLGPFPLAMFKENGQITNQSSLPSRYISGIINPVTNTSSTLQATLDSLHSISTDYASLADSLIANDLATKLASPNSKSYGSIFVWTAARDTLTYTGGSTSPLTIDGSSATLLSNFTHSNGVLSYTGTDSIVVKIDVSITLRYDFDDVLGATDFSEINIVRESVEQLELTQFIDAIGISDGTKVQVTLSGLLYCTDALDDFEIQITPPAHTGDDKIIIDQMNFTITQL